jgi:3-phenylpropionate/trans-cinnamate dioxygenase ferredoxin reductase component
MKGDGILIVGGGLAGQRCAEGLRRHGHDGRLRLVCAEDQPPYDRPPLSKAVLAGDIEPDSVRFRSDRWYEEAGVELLLGVRAVSLDAAARALHLSSGAALGFERLLIATGGQPRRLGLFDGRPNVHYLRTLVDARRLRAQMAPGARLAVVGAGFIGQEVAATARGLGLEVTLVEAMPTPLAGILGKRVGGWLTRMHRDRGVEVRTGAKIVAAHGRGRVEELEIDGGGRIPCDLVVVGVGSEAATDWLRGSGLEAAGGIATDACGRTRTPGVYAAGDASVPFDPRTGAHGRTEHWTAAAWQGEAVAKSMLGAYPGSPPLPSFWSDQYGLRIQYVGHAHRVDAALVDGDPSGADFEVHYTRAGAVVAGLAVGRPAAIPALRRRIEDGRRTAPDRELAA